MFKKNIYIIFDYKNWFRFRFFYAEYLLLFLVRIRFGKHKATRGRGAGGLGCEEPGPKS